MLFLVIGLKIGIEIRMVLETTEKNVTCSVSIIIFALTVGSSAVGFHIAIICSPRVLLLCSLLILHINLGMLPWKKQMRYILY